MKLNNSFLNNYKNLKVLITGTTGFKGAWLAFWLQKLGAKVNGISLKPEKNSILFKNFQLERKINQYIININDFNKIDNVVRKIKPDIIFHLAAQSIVSESFKKPLKLFKLIFWEALTYWKPQESIVFRILYISPLINVT